MRFFHLVVAASTTYIQFDCKPYNLRCIHLVEFSSLSLSLALHFYLSLWVCVIVYRSVGRSVGRLIHNNFMVFVWFFCNPSEKYELTGSDRKFTQTNVSTRIIVVTMILIMKIKKWKFVSQKRYMNLRSAEMYHGWYASFYMQTEPWQRKFMLHFCWTQIHVAVLWMFFTIILDNTNIRAKIIHPMA